MSIKALKRVPMRLWIIGLLMSVVLIVATVGVREYYVANLGPVSSSKTDVVLTIPSGASVKQIANLLQNRHLIRSATVFEWYVHVTGNNNKLEAGTYSLSPSYDLSKTVSILLSGMVTEGKVTILPGKTLAQIRNQLISDGYSAASVDQALNPAQYGGLPIMADVPSGTSTLEGLLFPDTFYTTNTTSVAQIVRESLIEMGKQITPSVNKAFNGEGLSVYQAITMASIIQQEVSKPSDMAQVAQVFFSRIKQGMPLGSDVTANYGAVINGQSPSLTYDSPYNTLIHTGLPPTPIGTISSESLNAVAHPANTNWLYFVSGDNGHTYFEQTIQQHNADTAAYCHKLCGQP